MAINILACDRPDEDYDSIKTRFLGVFIIMSILSGDTSFRYIG